MGKNKLKKFADMKDWAHVYEYAQSLYALEDCELKGHWHEKVFGNDGPIILELGCGKGEYTVGLARRYPDRNFIGIDIKGARMWTGAREAAEAGIGNAVFLRTHIEFLSHFFAPGEVSEIWLTFPDPQMKKVRKRLTSTRFLADYAAVMKPGALIHLKTDSQFMFTYTCAVADENRLPVDYRTDDLYRDGLQGLPDLKTFYEKQWLDRGLTIKYIRFALPEAGHVWTEPDIEIEPDPYRSFGRSARPL